MTETPTIVIEEDKVETLPAPKKPFPTKLVISLAAATAAVVVGGWLLSKNVSDDEALDSTDSDTTEEVMEETPSL